MSYPSTTSYIPQQEILVCKEGAIKKAVNIAANQTLVKGTVMAQLTSGGQWKPYVHGTSDGTQLALGILVQNVNTTAAGNGNNACVADVYVRGTFWYTRLTGTDAYFAGTFSTMQQQQITGLDILAW